MSYPQTNPNTAVSSNQEYWRLFTELGSCGDIYESEQSARALVIGPDSDIARAKIVYYDEQNPNLANEVIVSIDKPFIGRLDARGDQNYNSGDQGRLLISSADWFPPMVLTTSFYFPPTSSGVVEIVPPNLDLIQYLGNVPSSFSAPRNDKIHKFDQLVNDTNNPQWFMVPFFGRRFYDVSVKALGRDIGGLTTPSVIVTVFGINYSPTSGGASQDNAKHQDMLDQFHLNAPTTSNGVSNSVARATRNFDYLAVCIAKPNGSPDYPIETAVSTRIAVSDKV